MREEADLLNDIADSPPQLIDICMGNVRAVDTNGSLLRCEQPVHQLQGCGLAAAGTADHG